MFKQWPALLLFLGILFVPQSFALAGTILNAYKYAWSNNAGYVNFANVIVTDSALSGYAWSSNYGWIKFNPTNGGVMNDGNGHLSGSAWGEQLGWIDFSTVSINTTTGKFSGVATGSGIGILTFDCTYCDVRTDWQQGTQPSPSIPVVGGGSGNGNPLILGLVGLLTPSQVTANNVPLIISGDQSGTLTHDTTGGKVTLKIVPSTVQNKTTFIVADDPITPKNTFLISSGTELVNGVFYDVRAVDENGNQVHFFAHPITITLPIPARLTGATNLGVYWLNETNWQWVLIPDALFANGQVSFQVDHLTRFAIFETVTNQSQVPQKPTPNIPLPLQNKPTGTTPPSSGRGGTTLPQGQKGTNEESGTTTAPLQNTNDALVPLLLTVGGVILFLYFKNRKRDQ